MQSDTELISTYGAQQGSSCPSSDNDITLTMLAVGLLQISIYLFSTPDSLSLKTWGKRQGHTVDGMPGYHRAQSLTMDAVKERWQ